MKILEGGYIISIDNSESSLNNSIYFTCLPLISDRDEYLEIYNALSAIGFCKMYLIHYDDNFLQKDVMYFENEIIQFAVPGFEIFLYNEFSKKFEFEGNDISILTKNYNSVSVRGKNKYPIEDDLRIWLLNNLSQFSKKELKQLYVERLIFDGYIGFSKLKGKPSDIDAIGVLNSGVYEFLEIKEKDLPKKEKKGFGLDVPRINDFYRIQSKTKIDYRIFVRHINNQVERTLLEWLETSLDEFLLDIKNEKEVEGGTGMRSVLSSNPTKICSFDCFRKIIF